MSDVAISPRPLVALGHAASAAWALLVGMALLMVGSGLQGSLLGLRASFEEFGTATTGVVMSSFYFGFLIGSVRAPRLVANVGHIRVFAALSSIASSVVLLHAVVLEPAWWVLFRIVSGFCMAGLYVVAESWLNDTATNETRGALLSMYMVVSTAGMAVGQLLLTVAPPESFELFLLTSVLVSVALVPTSLSVRAAPRLLEPIPVSLREVFRAAPLGVVGVVLAGTATGAFFGVGVVYAQLAGLTLGETAAFMLVAILGGALVQLPVGALSDRVDRRRVIAGSALVAAAVCLFATTGPDRTVLLVAMFLVGASVFPMYALVVAHANDWLEPDQRVGASSRLVLAYGIGAVAGPLTGSLAMEGLDAAGFFWLLAAIHVAIAAYALWRMARRAARAEDERSHFAAIPARGSSVLVTTLAPDAWDDQDHPVFPTEEVPVVSPE